MNRRGLLRLLGFAPIAAPLMAERAVPMISGVDVTAHGLGIADFSGSRVLLLKSASAGKSEAMLDGIRFWSSPTITPMRALPRWRPPVVVEVVADEFDPFPSEVSP